MITEGPISLPVNSRTLSRQTKFSVEESSTSPTNALASICQSLFWHVVALFRLTFALCIICLKPAARLCNALIDGFLHRLKSRLNQLPHWAKLLGTSLKLRIRARLPCLSKIVYSTLVLPAKLIQAVLHYNEPGRGQHDSHAMLGGGFPQELQIDTVVSIRLAGRPPTRTAHSDYTHDMLSMAHYSTAQAFTDVPTLEERSGPGHGSSNLLESPLSQKLLFDNSDEHQAETTTSEDSHRSEVQPDDQDHSAGLSVASFGLLETGEAMTDDASSDSIDPLEQPQGFPTIIEPLPNSDEPNHKFSREYSTIKRHNSVPVDFETLSVSTDIARAESFSPLQLSLPYTGSNGPIGGIPTFVFKPLYGANESHLESPREFSTRRDDSGPADDETLSISTDRAHAESFSPVQLSLPYINRKEPISGIPGLPSYSTQEGQEADQPPTCPSSATLTPPDDHPTSIQRSYSSSIAEDNKANITEWARISQSESSIRQPEFNNPFQEHDDTDYCASETTSCYDDPFTSATKTSARQRSGGDECDETCISCETCNRRHKRVRGSRIPRRTKTSEYVRRRSSSFASCQSVQTTVSAGTVVRRKLQKRKVKAC